jgi:hypothetical protein
MTMSNPHCRCGYQAGNDDDLAAHLSEALVPDDDLTADGVVHAECPSAAESKACLCGFSAIDPATLDTHRLTAFTSADGLGTDGRVHGGCVPATPSPPA